jgi:hypothetical protein
MLLLIDCGACLAPAGTAATCTGTPPTTALNVASWACTGGTTCTATCRSLYGPGIGQSVTATCPTGTWIVSGTCKAGLCPGNPTTINTGVWSCTGGTTNERCYARCNNGLAANTGSLCGSSASWTYVSSASACVQCTATTCCSKAGLTSTGALFNCVDLTTSGYTCPGSCTSGFTGTPSAICKTDGTWTVTSACTQTGEDLCSAPLQVQTGLVTGLAPWRYGLQGCALHNIYDTC